MALLEAPVIDIAPFAQGSQAERRAVTGRVDEACIDIGFLVISGHGVPRSLISDVAAASRAYPDLTGATFRQAMVFSPATLDRMVENLKKLGLPD